MMSRQVQSKMVKRGAVWENDGSSHVIHDPTASANMRHGFDINPPNWRPAPIAWPNKPTYAVSNAKIADQ